MSAHQQINKDLNTVPFVSVDHMMKIVGKIGLENMLKGIAAYIEEDFKRWQLFDKTPRVASHSEKGVIELMPTSDGELYGFKYVNGHPKNMAPQGYLWVDPASSGGRTPCGQRMNFLRNVGTTHGQHPC